MWLHQRAGAWGGVWARQHDRGSLRASLGCACACAAFDMRACMADAHGCVSLQPPVLAHGCLAVQLEEPFSILPLENILSEVELVSEDMIQGMASARAPLAGELPRASATKPEVSRRAGGNVQMGMRRSVRPRTSETQMIVGLPEPTHLLDTVTAATSMATVSGQPLLLAALSTVEMEERYFLAGGLCASISHALATPIDVVKTRQQTMPSYASLGLLNGLRRVALDDGPVALLTGIVPTVVGYGAEGALKFGVYELLKPSTSMLLSSIGLGAEQVGLLEPPTESCPPLHFAAIALTPIGWHLQVSSLGPISAAIVAGGLASLVLAPAEATRIRMVSDERYAGLSLSAAATTLYEAEGPAGLLRGVPATCSKQLPYTATKQVTFDALIDAGTRAGLERWTTTIGAALIAAVLSTLASQPGDAILSQVRMAQRPSSSSPAAASGVAPRHLLAHPCYYRTCLVR